MSNLLSLTSAQLKQAADIKDKIEALNKELGSLLGASTKTVKPAAKAKKGMSAAGRAKVAAAQRARWAKIHAAKGKNPTAKAVVKAAKPAKKKNKMSAATKAIISAKAKARWAKIKAAKKA